MEHLKEKLHRLCIGYIQERMLAAQKAIENAQEASQSETKSSAGDKYETGRAMAQQEIDRNKLQLTEAARQKQMLERINPHKISESVQPGSLVYTNYGNFYVGISAGQFTVNGETVFAVSPASPIGLKLAGLEKGAEIEFNSKMYKVLKVC